MIRGKLCHYKIGEKDVGIDLIKMFGDLFFQEFHLSKHIYKTFLTSIYGFDKKRKARNRKNALNFNFESIRSISFFASLNPM